MALDKITSKNFLSKGGPYIHVYAPWYNELVDAYNNLTTAGVMINSDGIVANATGQIPDMPLVGSPSLVHIFFDDFIHSVASAAPTLGWTNTKEGTGTSLLIDAAGGVLQMTCQATTDDSAELNVYQQETFRLATGKKLWYEIRFRCPAADVTNIDLSLGLIVYEAMIGVDDNKPANGIVFIKTDAGVGTVLLNVSDNNTDKVSPASIKTIVTNTWTRLGFYFDGGATGLATITPYVDGVAGQPISGVTYATMSEMSPFMLVRNGDATTTQILDVDYVYVVQER